MLKDVVYAWRALRAMPLVSSVVVASLALGIGANTVVFSWLEMVRWKPLPGVASASALYTIEPRTDGGMYVGSSWMDYRDLRERLSAFQSLLAFRMTPLTVGKTPHVERAAGLLVSGNYFASLGLHAAAGRLLVPGDAAAPGRQPVAVISYDYWQTRLAGSASVIQSAMRVNGLVLTIVGVAPQHFQGTTLGLAFDMWVPATMAAVLVKGSSELDDRAQRGYVVMGRLRQAVTASAAQGELDTAMRELAAAYPESHQTLGAEVTPFTRPPRGPQRMIGAVLVLLQGLMLLVLVAVCGNTANLLLARASVRQREFGVRLALGSSRRRVAGLLILEALLLGLAGTAAGVLLAVWGTQALRAGDISGALPIRFQTQIDVVGLVFAAGLGGLSAGVTAAVPAWLMARMHPLQALRAGSRHASRSPLRQSLVGIQVALALFVLVVAGLFFERFAETRDPRPGFRADGVLLAAYDLTGRGTDASTNLRFAGRVLAALGAMPGVESAALASAVPLDIHGLPSRSFVLEGRTRGRADRDEALSNVVTPGYLKTMGIPLLAGTDFAPLDDVVAVPQAIVNEAFARQYLAGADPIGRRLESGGVSYTIVGVAGTTVSDAFGEPPTPLVFYSYRDRPLPFAEVHVRTAGAEVAMTAAIRQAIAELDAGLPVYNVRTLSDHIARNLVLRRVPARMFLVLGPLLLMLAAIGVYAVVDYSVAQRRAEIGLRLALGAPVRQVVGLIVRETIRAVALGAAAATALAVGVELHLVRGGARDVPVLVAVPVLLVAVAAVACWIPARRASAVSPADVLRSP